MFVSQGVKTLKSLPRERVDPFYIALVPESLQVLQERLEKRGDTSPASMRKRLDTASIELEHTRIPGFFDRVIISAGLDETYEAFKKAIMESQEHPKL
jgi:guanylate kinase